MGGRIHPGVLVVKHVWQWFWDHDWLGRKYKAIYFGPRLDWMKLFKKWLTFMLIMCKFQYGKRK